ncbi:MAG: hypothetical protein NTU93_12520 [Arthrobacter sp.]|nr:hypothetical protein [Arthrobacter sp.]
MRDDLLWATIPAAVSRTPGASDITQKATNPAEERRRAPVVAGQGINKAGSGGIGESLVKAVLIPLAAIA